MTTTNAPARGTIVSDAPAHTLDVGRRLGAGARAGDVIALTGPLGAGKTILAKGIAAGLGVRTVVNSPTFVLMNQHDGRLRLFHVDVYRLDDPEEAIAAGVLDDAHAAGVTVVEWADRLDGHLPEDRLDIRIDPAGDDRRDISWNATGPRHARLSRMLEDFAGRDV